MMPEEWPIAATSAAWGDPARAAGRGRLSTVRTDFSLNPAERLTEQERALMTAMLHSLISDISSEIRAALPSGWVGGNDEDPPIVDVLSRARLLNDVQLVLTLLRAAEEQRIGTAARARTGRQEARALQALVSNEDGEVSAAAMALVLARGRRRDRFGQSLVSFDDLQHDTADRLVHAVAAALRSHVAAAHTARNADAELSRAAADLLARHDHARSIDTLTAALAGALDEHGALTDEMLRACTQEGEVRFLAEALGRGAGIEGQIAMEVLLSGDAHDLVTLLRVAGVTREMCASFLASIGDLVGIADPGGAIDVFDRMGSEEVESAASWLRTSPRYRAALDAIREHRG